jgi:hypothetical protein
VTLDILRGNLEGVEKEAGTARVEAEGAKGIENLGEGDLNGAAVFEDGKSEGPVRGYGRLRGKAVEAGVKVAIRLASQSRRMALGSVGHDVAALVRHCGPFPTPPYFCKEILCFQQMRQGLRAKFLIRREFFADYS